MTHIGQPLVKFGQNPNQNPKTLFYHLKSSGTFVVFSKFHPNTSNSPNTKVVKFFMGHKCHVEWHWRFEAEIGEKPRSTPPSTIHRRPEIW
jgi:hypothetical protein